MRCDEAVHCAACGREAEPVGMGGLWVTESGRAIAYVLCAACTRRFQRDRGAVLDRVEERIGEGLESLIC